MKLLASFCALGALASLPFTSAVSITDIQGVNFLSPLVGQTVNNLTGLSMMKTAAIIGRFQKARLSNTALAWYYGDLEADFAPTEWT